MILLVEDEELLRAYSTEMIEGLGYRVLAARNATEAEEAFRRSRGRIDLVLSDLVMPGRSGLELFRRLRAIDSRVPFILVSGHHRVEGHDELLEQIEAVLHKPYTIETIAAAIDAALDGGAKGRQLPPEARPVCEQCARPCPTAELCWDEGRHLWLCTDCAAEAESCGCSDE